MEGAVARPQNLWLYENESDIVVLGVRLIEAIGKNHCFQQGNKRTAFFAGVAFIEMNGCPVRMGDTLANALLVEGLITGSVYAADIVEAMRAT